MTRRGSLRISALAIVGLALTLGSGSVGASGQLGHDSVGPGPSDTAVRTEAALLRSLIPTDRRIADFIHVTDEVILPGEPFGVAVGPLDDLIASRRFVVGLTTIYETVDERVGVVITHVDMGDPAVLRTVNLDDWSRLEVQQLDQAVLASPDNAQGVASFIWSRGPVLSLFQVQPRIDDVPERQLVDLVTPLLLEVERSTPALPTISPQRPASAVDEARLVASSAFSLIFTLLALRWLISIVIDGSTRQRLAGRVGVRRRRVPSPAQHFCADVSKTARRYLWAVRAGGLLRLVGLSLAVIGGASVFVLLSNGYSIAVWPIVALVAVVGLSWSAAPVVARTLTVRLTRGQFRPGTGVPRRARRWLHAPLSAGLVVVGTAVSLSLLAVGVGAMLRASTVQATGAGGVVGPDATQDVRQGFFVLGVVALGLSAVPFSLARRAAQRSAAVSLGHDLRPPALLLRSFADDRLRVRSHRTARGLSLAQLKLSPRDRFEEILAWTLWRHGPVTTLGQPGSRLPPLGATREYYLDDNWHEAVAGLIDASPVIVVVVDTTAALEWEIGQIRARGALDRTVFVVPPTRQRRRIERLRKLESQLGVGRRFSRLAASTEPLAIRLRTDGTPSVYAAEVADDLAYEVALDQACSDISSRPLPVRSTPATALSRPAPRGSRPKERSSGGRSWAAAGVVMLISSGIESITPLNIPESRAPDRYLDFSANMLSVVKDGPGIFAETTGRSKLLYSEGTEATQWEYALPTNDRLRDFAITPERVAVSSYNGLVQILDRGSGAVVADVRVGEASSSVALADSYVLATQPSSGSVVVADLDGALTAEVTVDGMPLQVHAEDGRAVVVSAFTQQLIMIDLGTFEVSEIDVGTELRGLAVMDGVAYSLSRKGGAIIRVDLKTEQPSELAVEDLAAPRSNFDEAVRAETGWLVTRLYDSIGVHGLVVLDAEEFTPTRIWTLALGPPTEFDFYNGYVYTGSIVQPGWFGWSLP